MVNPVDTRDVLITVDLAGQFVTSAAHEVMVTSWVEYRVSVVGTAGAVVTGDEVRPAETSDAEDGEPAAAGDEVEAGETSDAEDGEAAAVLAAGTEYVVNPVETREVLTTVDLAGQFVTSAAHEVTVTSWVEYKVSVVGTAGAEETWLAAGLEATGLTAELDGAEPEATGLTTELEAYPVAGEVEAARVELAKTTVEEETVAVEVTAEVMTDGVVKTVVLPAVVNVCPTGQVVMVELTISVV